MYQCLIALIYGQMGQWMGGLAVTAVITSNGWRRLEGCRGTRGTGRGATQTGAGSRRNKVLSAARL